MPYRGSSFSSTLFNVFQRLKLSYFSLPACLYYSIINQISSSITLSHACRVHVIVSYVSYVSLKLSLELSSFQEQFLYCDLLRLSLDWVDDFFFAFFKNKSPKIEKIDRENRENRVSQLPSYLISDEIITCSFAHSHSRFKIQDSFRWNRSNV